MSRMPTDSTWSAFSDGRREDTTTSIRQADVFQKRFLPFLLKGRYEDERGLRLRSSGRVLVKRYAGADGTCGVVVWNLKEIRLLLFGVLPKR